MRSSIITALALTAALAGCKSESKKPSEPAKPEAVAPAGPKKLGLADPNNDPQIVAAVKKTVDGCGGGFTDKKGFEWDCAAYKEWNNQNISWGRHDSTLVNLVEDADKKVRTLGIRALSRWGNAFREDKALAERVVAALEVETVEANDGVLAAVVAGIKLDKLGLMPRIEKLVAAGNDDVRHGLVFNIFTGSPGSEAGYQMVVAQLKKTQNKQEIENLISALSGAGIHGDEICTTWSSYLTHADVGLASEAAARITRGRTGWGSYDSDSSWSTSNSAGIQGPNPCASLVDGVLSSIDAKAAAGELTRSELIDALRGVLNDKSADPKQQELALAIARKTVENTKNTVRSSALWLIADKAPDAKTYSAKFANDSDKNITYVVEQIAKRK